MKGKDKIENSTKPKNCPFKNNKQTIDSSNKQCCGKREYNYG